MRELFGEIGKDIACVIVEPVAGNMNCIPPVPGFLEALREECTRHGAVLIFDEVMTGFRVAKGGAQELYGIKPDLTTLGKIVGGGMPVGVFGGRRDIMSHIAPLGPVYQAGTLSGNPVAMAAGLATLNGIDVPGFHALLARLTDRLVHGIKQAAQQAGVPLATNHVCGMFGLFFTSAPHGKQLRRSHGLRRRAFQEVLPRHARKRACTSRRPRSKRDSFRLRTPKPTSTRRSRPLPGCSRDSDLPLPTPIRDR